jgi:hypothetical protein
VCGGTSSNPLDRLGTHIQCITATLVIRRKVNDRQIAREDDERVAQTEEVTTCRSNEVTRAHQTDVTNQRSKCLWYQLTLLLHWCPNTFQAVTAPRAVSEFAHTKRPDRGHRTRNKRKDAVNIENDTSRKRNCHDANELTTTAACANVISLSYHIADRE